MSRSSRGATSASICDRTAGDETMPVWLPIDVKFPTADYERLALAAERGDADDVELACARSSCAFREAARDICGQVRPPAAQHGLRGDVPADRGPLSGSSAARPDRCDPAANATSWSPGRRALYAFDADADGVPLSRHPEAFGRSMEGARRGEARIREIRRGHRQGQQEAGRGGRP